MRLGLIKTIPNKFLVCITALLGTACIGNTPNVCAQNAADPIPLEGMALWLKADAGVETEEDSVVQRWTDSGPGGYIFEKRGFGEEVLLNESSIFGQPSVVFNAGDYLDIDRSSLDDEDAPFSNFNYGMSIFVVASAQRETGPVFNFTYQPKPQTLLDIGASWQNNNIVLQRQGITPDCANNPLECPASKLSLGVRSNNSQNLPLARSELLMAEDRFTLISLVQGQGGYASFFDNGKAAGQGLTIQPYEREREEFRIGAALRSTTGDGWNGEIAEIILYKTALSEFDRQAVETYLRRKYGFFDEDGDGLPAWLEMQLGTSDQNADSNNDGVADADPEDAGTDPGGADTDGDGVSNLEEQRRGTDPLDPDSKPEEPEDSDDSPPVITLILPGNHEKL